MDPPSPASELDRTNVTLFCDAVDGNPPELISVKWYVLIFFRMYVHGVPLESDIEYSE